MNGEGSLSPAQVALKRERFLKPSPFMERAAR
ncbi:MAG: hypothetical protein JWM10_3634 [Myxococcaceae bacterium]|nr:hypothetical protein [Myxococcaceae bacterium]